MHIEHNSNNEQGMDQYRIRDKNIKIVSLKIMLTCRKQYNEETELNPPEHVKHSWILFVRAIKYVIVYSTNECICCYGCHHPMVLKMLLTSYVLGNHPVCLNADCTRRGDDKYYDNMECPQHLFMTLTRFSDALKNPWLPNLNLRSYQCRLPLRSLHSLRK